MTNAKLGQALLQSSPSTEPHGIASAWPFWTRNERPSAVRTDIRPDQSPANSYLDDIDRTEAAAERTQEDIGIRNDRGTCFGPGLTLPLVVPRASQKMIGECRNG